MRLAASLRDSDLAADDAGNADKPMRRSVSWPDWSENRYDGLRYKICFFPLPGLLVDSSQ